MHHHEFAALTKFCIGHFGSVRNLCGPGGRSGTSTSSTDPNDNIERGRFSGTTLTTGSSFVASELSPSTRILSSQISPSHSTSNWIPKSAQPRSLTKMLVDAERKASMVHNSPQCQNDPPDKDDEMLEVTSGSQPREKAEQIIGQIGRGMEDHRVTESVLLSWIQDDSFMEEVLSFQFPFFSLIELCCFVNS
jgi:hypothetical protein